MTYEELVERAQYMLKPIRIHGTSEGPMYGQIKVEAAQVYATLALADRVDALLGHFESQESSK